MNDTSPEVETLYRERLMALSGSQRFLRGARMFEAAREMVLASLPAGTDEGTARRALLRRFYGQDLEPGELAAAEDAVGRRAAPGAGALNPLESDTRSP